MRPLLALLIILAPGPAAAQGLAVVDRPLATDTAHVPDAGRLQLGIGAEFVRLGPDESLTSAPVLTGRLGVAGVGEVSAAYRWLWRDDNRGPDASGTGDLFLFGKLRLLDGLDDEGRPTTWPAVAARIGVKLPNASADERLGTNNTDFSMLVLVTERAGPVELRVAAGLQILESPYEALTQNDARTGSAALLLHLPGGLVPFVEYYVQDVNVPAFDFAEARAGVRWTRRRISLDLSASAGLSGDRPLGYAGELSREWGVAAGVSWRLEVPGFGRTWGRSGSAPASWR
jgi:hypothetical protein